MVTRTPSSLVLCLLFFVCLGAFYRLIWAEDMEYKKDERWTFQRVQAFRTTGEAPLLGMPSSQKVRNPGMSIWVFLGLGALGIVDGPVDLGRMVQIFNVVGLAGLILFVFLTIPAEEQEIWLWAAAFLAVNPMAILWQRKIWAQSALPPFTLLFLAAWWYRHLRWGAFLWGLLGPCLGQIHIPAFFFSAAFFLWALLFDRKRTSWRWWVAGSVLGSLPLIPWLHYMLQGVKKLPGSENSWWQRVNGYYWIHYIQEGFGFGLKYSLGEDYGEFLRYPAVAGHPTYLMLGLLAVLGLTGATLLAQGCLRQARRKNSWLDLFSGRGSMTLFTQNAALIGYGAFLWLSGFVIYPHYLVVLFVLRYLFIPLLARDPSGSSGRILPRGRLLLTVVLICQAALSGGLLCYIHGKENIRGDYGVPYSSQAR